LKEDSEATVRTLVDMEGSYLSANFFREIVAAESFSYDPNRPKPQFVTLTGVCALCVMAVLGRSGGSGAGTTTEVLPDLVLCPMLGCESSDLVMRGAIARLATTWL
jgi:hypothetical protein